MGKRSSYPPGAFSWVDLATNDAGAAKAFYTQLLGWETVDEDAGDGAVYTMCQLEGDAVAGLFALPGVPPMWTSYVTVADADATAARVEELGGRVLNGAFDVLDAGRMATLADPQGAVFAVWQPGARIGAERVNDVGCLCMNELMTGDLDAARAFYEALFGWTTVDVDTGPDGPAMAFAQLDGRNNASMFGAPGEPPHWRACFTVASAQDAAERVRALGGTVHAMLPVDEGSLAVADDPQGARFSLFEGQTDD